MKTELKHEPLYVARPLMPDLPEVVAMLEEIWVSRQVTNEGPFHGRLEGELAQVLGVPVAKLTCNGTVALQCALLSLDLPPGGEVITSPVTFAATAHAISACGLKPVFADVDEVSLTLDPKAVERAITPRTVAVMAVHVYGTLCDHKALQNLCDIHGLKLIFDAAHAFAAFDGETPVGMLGDLSVFSLHATKLFSTFEGGLITSKHMDMAHKIRLARNFGIENEEVVSAIGINGKMSELNAVIGLANLKIMEQERAFRKVLRSTYNSIVDRFPGIQKQLHQPNVKQSEQYYMIMVDPDVFGVSRDKIYDLLKENGIFSRKYFWPVCTDFACYLGEQIFSLHDIPVVERIKDRVLCLPFHSGVKPNHIDVIEKVLETLSRQIAKNSKEKNNKR